MRRYERQIVTHLAAGKPKLVDRARAKQQLLRDQLQAQIDADLKFVAAKLRELSQRRPGWDDAGPPKTEGDP